MWRSLNPSATRLYKIFTGSKKSYFALQVHLENGGTLYPGKGGTVWLE